MVKIKGVNTGSGVVESLDIGLLVESPTNPRKHFDEKALAQQALSIMEKGIIEPVIVRQLPDNTTYNGSAKYEIVVGARRFRSSKMTGKEILKHFPDAQSLHLGLKEFEGQKLVPCMIREYSDNEVLEIQVIENNQREDIHPLEEGEGYAALLKVEGYTVEAIAMKIGRSDKYVRERLQLAQLSPKAKECYEKNKIFYTHARLLARLTIQQQEDALINIIEDEYPTNSTHPVSVKSLEKWIESNIEKGLGSAPFPLDDTTLVKSAGACNVCPKNTACDGQLFPEYATSKKGICLDPKCYHSKVKAVGERKIKEKVEDSGKEVLLVTDRRYDNSTRKFKTGEKTVIGAGNYEIVNKSDKGAQEAVLVGSSNMEKKGKTVWVKLKGDKDKAPKAGSPRRTAPAEKEETPEQKAEKERKENHEQILFWEQWSTFIKEAIIKQSKKLDEKIFSSALRDAVNQELNSDFEGIFAGISAEEWKNTKWDKRRKVFKDFIESKKSLQLYPLLVLAHEIDSDKFTETCQKFGVDAKKCRDYGLKIADEKFPDPEKQLIITLVGLPWKLKESDHLTALQVLSEKVKKSTAKDKLKHVNIMTGPKVPNITFRMDAKLGKYKFSEFIDMKDGTALGFNMMKKTDFLKYMKAIGKGK